MINLQPTFDKVVNHLLQQKRKATDESGNNCRYLTDTGLKCAVGCLINAAHYQPAFEGSCPDWVNVGSQTKPEVSYEIFNAVLNSQQLTPADDDERMQLGMLLRKLQSTHDNYDVEDWPEHLEYLAVDLDLKFTPPQPQ